MARVAHALRIQDNVIVFSSGLPVYRYLILLPDQCRCEGLQLQPDGFIHKR